VLMYADVMDRVAELVEPYSTIYPVGNLAWRPLESTNSIMYVENAKDAVWMVASTLCSKFHERLAEFCTVAGLGCFALVGDDVRDILPSNLHVTSVEEYADGVFLLVGKKVGSCQ